MRAHICGTLTLCHTLYRFITVTSGHGFVTHGKCQSTYATQQTAKRELNLQRNTTTLHLHAMLMAPQDTQFKLHGALGLHELEDVVKTALKAIKIGL